MPRASTRIDVCRGHDACKPRPFETWSPNVYVEGYAVVREGDKLKAHACGDHSPHGALVIEGWKNVFVNNARVTVIGSLVNCLSHKIKTGRPTVMIGSR